MKVLKVKSKTVDFDGNGLVRLSRRASKTVIKHKYHYVQLQGVVYPLSTYKSTVFIENYYTK